ncbi:hypothetical protein GCM10022221_49690 [Actinocorallia aurea]
MLRVVWLVIAADARSKDMPHRVATVDGDLHDSEKAVLAELGYRCHRS